MAHNINTASGGGADLRAATLALPGGTDFNINADAGGGQALRDATLDLSDGTTLYLFHPWIEASETGDTVLSLFGQWWDGDAGGGGGGAAIPELDEGMLVGGLCEMTGGF